MIITAVTAERIEFRDPGQVVLPGGLTTLEPVVAAGFTRAGPSSSDDPPGEPDHLDARALQ
jgi:hypothetical protein